MIKVVETAYAKINLALHVRARRPDGYHELETLFAFADAGDGIEVEPAEDLSLSIAGPFAEELAACEDNLVLRAARTMQAHFGVSAGAHVQLDKHLPIMAGLGGGSADAAAVARALNRLWGVDADEAALAAAVGRLGADVPVCVGSRTIIGKGIGTITENASIPGISGAPILLVNPRRPCPTGQVYQGWDCVDRGSLGLHRGGWRNDLTPSAVALVPEIGMLLYMLAELEGATQVAMSGSGATCFALFESEAARDQAHGEMIDMQPAWWTMAARLR